MSRQAILTPRLALEPLTELHASLIVELASTQEVMRFIGDGSPWPTSRSEEVAAACLEHWRIHDFGWRAAVDRGSGAPIGVGALNFAGEGSGVDPHEYEIGWWLAPTHWGRGLGTEVGAALCDEAFARLHAPSVVARIQAANGASGGVASALGLTPEGESRGRAGEVFTVWRLAVSRWQELTAEPARAGA